MGKNTIFAAVFAFAALPLFANVRLENQRLAVEFDDSGNLVSLKNKISGEDYAGGQGLWRAIYRQNELLEEPVESGSAAVSVAGADFVEADGMGDFKVSGGGSKVGVSLSKDALALLVFKKNK